MYFKCCAQKITTFAVGLTLVLSQPALATSDLDRVKESGVLKHIGVPYANFVSYIDQGETSTLVGLDVEIIKGFARSLNVRYEYVPAKWSNVFSKLTGQKVEYKNTKLRLGEQMPIEGDLIANGMTILDWRKEVITFSDDYFPSAVWLVARSDSILKPIKPTGAINNDILAVKSLISGRKVMAMEHSCLDPNLYNLYDTGANVVLPNVQRRLNEIVPALMKNESETALLDVADTLVALEKWPGEIKVIGPISDHQRMAVAFRKTSPELKAAFNRYLHSIKKDGTYQALVEKYYPSIYYFYNDYFLENK